MSSTRASATPSTGGAGGGGTRASRRRERRALAKGATSDPPDPPSGGGSRAVDAKRVPAPTGALVVDARGAAVGRDGAVDAKADISASAEVSSEASRAREATPPRDGDGVSSDEAPFRDDTSSTSTSASEDASTSRAEAPSENNTSDRDKSGKRSTSPLAVETSQRVHLGSAATVPDALRRLRIKLIDVTRDAADGTLPPFTSGVVRLTVSAPRHVDALEWLRGAHSNARSRSTKDDDPLLPAYYLSPRTPPPAVRSGDGDDAADDETNGYAHRGGRERERNGRTSKERARVNDVAEPSSWRADPRGAVAAAGGAVVWTGSDGFDGDVLADVRRFVGRDFVGGADDTDRDLRVYGAGRFDPETAPAEEWARFGGHYFFLPTLEVSEGARCATVAVTLAWDARFGDDEDDAVAARKRTRGAASLAAAVASAADAIDAALGESPLSPGLNDSTKSKTHGLRLAPPGSATPMGKTLEPDRAGWSAVVDGLLQKLREGEAAAAEAARRAERAIAAAEAAEEASLRATEGDIDTKYAYADDVSAKPSRRATNYVWDERDAYGEDAYIDDFASGDGYGGGAVSSSGRSIRDRLLDLGRAAGVEAPPAAVLKELEAFAMAAGLGSAAGSPADGGDVFSGSGAFFSPASGRGARVDRNVGDAGSVGIGWSVDESVDDDDDVDTAATTLLHGASDVSFAKEKEKENVDVLRKVVLARRSTLTFTEPMDALALVASLRSRDPDAYQFALVHSDGAAFVGSTPERLFSSRDGRAASEAVAGTRPRGADEGEDAALAYEMLLSPKEHEEFSIVREEVRNALATVAKDGSSGVKAELEKGVLRHVSVQHLYARLGCELANGTSEADVLEALHPTPAVCGHPRAAALDAIRSAEPFDRGLYAGPLGWIGPESAEFAVAIRSALIETNLTTKTTNAKTTTVNEVDDEHTPGTVMRLYAGVGVVAAADAVAEWRELNLKTTPLESLVAKKTQTQTVSKNGFETSKQTDSDGRTRGSTSNETPSQTTTPEKAPSIPLANALNANQAWAEVLIGELFRDGVRVFCVAPGSRSTPLALAAERHPSARVVVCVDERSLAFYALGVGKGAGAAHAGAAVICSSGTAVANLLPAAVEAAESASPLLLLTADRPPELRGTGANQTIDQCKIFGTFTRYYADLPPPGDGAPARVWATAANAATRVLRGSRPGPVHLNCQFRDPLGPVRAPWNPTRDLRGLEGWETRTTPHSFSSRMTRDALEENEATRHAYGDALSASVCHDGNGNGESRASAVDAAGAKALADLARSARRGVLVVAGGASDGAAAALAATELASVLGWAVIADAAGGLRAGAGDPNAFCPHLLNAADLSLCSSKMRAFFKPDVIVQINPRLTSKRVQTALETAALDHGAAWAVVSPQETRADPAHCVSLHVSADAATVAAALAEALHAKYAYRDSSNFASCACFRDALLAADAAASREARRALRDLETEEGITEMGVALAVADALPRSMGLFLGNSMPIRDVDALAGVSRVSRVFDSNDFSFSSEVAFGPGAPTAANRGASGIDGVLSAAAGYAAGLGKPVTLLVGDVSFQHDANGLLLLRERPGQPPVTTVVVNNGGGGIFSFLPVSEQIDAARFTKLFATPPDVSRRGLCEAHRVAHAHPSTPSALRKALDAAWSEGRHSVVEVTTSRARNLAQHRALQRRVAEAVDAALALGERFGDVPGDVKMSVRESKADASDEDIVLRWPKSSPRAVVAATVSRFALPMLREPTTTVKADDDEGDDASNGGDRDHARSEKDDSSNLKQERVGYILEVRLANGAVGRGEASPLPGLHRETAEEAGAQLRVVACLLESVEIPATLPLLGGAVTEWLVNAVGVRVVETLLPSVRFAVESAALAALCASAGRNGDETETETERENSFLLADALEKGAARAASFSSFPERDDTRGDTTRLAPRAVEINALIASCDGDTPESAANEALRLIHQGYRCLKIKVARGVGAAGAAADADRVEAIRDAVGPDVTLRCDANRGWSLNDALVFGLRVTDLNLQYVEEPVRDVENDLAAFHCTTGVPVALDESVDDVFAKFSSLTKSSSVADALEELFEPTFGVVALVLKPGVLGGFEACSMAAAAARTKGINAVVTTAFESGVGVAACAHLAAALDAAAERAAREAIAESKASDHHGTHDDDDVDDVDDVLSDTDPQNSVVSEDENAPAASRLGAMRHGLGTGAWLDGDVTSPPSAPLVSNNGNGVGVALLPHRDANDAPFPFVASSVTERTSETSWGSIAFKEVFASTGTYRFRIRDSRGAETTSSASASEGSASVLFLHGFMGGLEDWDAVARGLSSEARCVAVDMPGHGATSFAPKPGRSEADGYEVEAMAEAISKLGDALFGDASDDAPVTVVGYSMGARVALAAAAALAEEPSSPNKNVSFLKKKRGGGVVSIGGSPGIAGAEARKNRAERDDAMANALRASGVESFARAWYRQGLFRSLTAHPRYSVSHLASLRARSCSCGDDEEASRSAAERLASLLSAASPGRQNVIDAETLASSGTRLDFVTGAADTKFVKVAETLAEEIRTVARSSGQKNKNARVTTTLVPGAGHAAHLEAPETLVLRLLRVVRDDE